MAKKVVVPNTTQVKAVLVQLSEGEAPLVEEHPIIAWILDGNPLTRPGATMMPILAATVETMPRCWVGVLYEDGRVVYGESVFKDTAEFVSSMRQIDAQSA